MSIYSEEQLRQIAASIVSGSSYRVEKMLPSEFAEKYMVLDKSVSPARAGKFSYDYTPYTREIVDCFSADIPVNEVFVMKSAQCGVSQGVIINGLVYRIVHAPANIVLLSGTAELNKEFIATRLEPAIDSVGARDLLRAHRKNMSGDTTDMKQFVGGFLKFGGVKNLSSAMRQTSLEIIIADDWEEARNSDKGGDAYALTQTRLATAGYKRLGMYISTPELEHNSQIYKGYLQGDQRKFHITCEHCGEKIYLEWRPRDEDGLYKKVQVSGKGKKLVSGLIYDTYNGLVVEDSVRYRCYRCGGEFKERHKHSVMRYGEYIPTSTAVKKGMRSYHIGGLLAPKGQRSWFEMAEMFNDAAPESGNINVKKLQTFRNTVEGFPFREIGKSMDDSKLQSNVRSEYAVGTVPDELSEKKDGNGRIVLLTTAIDLNGHIDDARADYEVVAWSETGSNYSVTHGSIGSFKPYSDRKKMKKEELEHYERSRVKFSYERGVTHSAWDSITELIETIYVGQSGAEYRSVMNVIDCSNPFRDDDDKGTLTAYKYIDEMAFLQGKFVFGVKGKAKLKTVDADNSIYKKSSERENLLIIDVHLIKNMLSEMVNYSAIKGGDRIQDAGCMNFPVPSDGKYTYKSYFAHYIAEHCKAKHDASGREIGYEWVKIKEHVHNHHLDTRVYNIAAKEVMQMMVTKENKMPNTWEAFCFVVKNVQ